jgi:hypothetical protein
MSNSNPKRAINHFYNCAKCIAEKPAHLSMEEFARFSFGPTDLGFQLWCVRHDVNVLHIDLQGNRVAADTTIDGTFEEAMVH